MTKISSGLNFLSIFLLLSTHFLLGSFTDEDLESDEPGGCPRDREEAAKRGRTCLRKCKSNKDCISSRKKCRCDGMCGWSCVRPDLHCEGLPHPENGRVNLSGDSFGDKATYSCNEGYWISGHNVRICQGNGNWSEHPPVCKLNGKSMCGPPPSVRFARVSAPADKSNFETDSMVQYRCFPGYEAKGFARAKCIFYNGTAQWFGPDLRCNPRDCGPPADIKNGRREGDVFTYTGKVSYFCDDGFDLTGKFHIYCTSNGQWSNSAPSCNPVQCFKPKDPHNGRAVYTSFSYNSVVKYECRYGYRLVGSNTRICGKEKKWEGNEPYCEEIDCGHPGPLYNGYIEGKDTGMGSEIYFHCFNGMKMENVSNKSICRQNGTWSHHMPKCLAPCIVPEVAFGSVTEYTPGSRVEHGQEIVVICEKHYELAYHLIPAVCSNGTWSHVPTCIPARCRQLPEKPRNGMVIAPKTDHGMKALFKCKDGFKLVGPNVTSCYYGNWTEEEIPICKEIYCPFPGSLENGRVLLVGYMGMYDYRSYVKKVTNNKQIMYECNRHYTLKDGPPGATCVDGQWSPPQLPLCVRGSHPILSVRRRRRREATQRRQHRKVLGRRRRVKLPRSKEKIIREPCSPFLETAWMQVEIIKLGRGNDSLPHGTVVNVTCSAGYRLNIGNRTAKCVRGRWKPKTPECVTSPCDVPSTPNGVYHHFQRTVSAEDTVEHGEVLTLSCLPGYQLMGPDTLRCWYGTWAVDNLPECVPRPCELPVILQGHYLSGYRSGLTISHGSSIDYECKLDYVKVTEESIRCAEGELRPQVPACQHFSLKSTSVKTPDGVQETDIRYRQPDSTDSAAVDMPLGLGWRPCGPPERQENILVYPAGRGAHGVAPSVAQRDQGATDPDGSPLQSLRTFPHNTEVRFTCITGITGEKTTWKIVCEDGNWVGGAYKCEAEPEPPPTEDRRNKSCILENKDPNLVAFEGDRRITSEMSEHPPHTELVFRCKDIGKFSMIGSVRRRCIHGDWDGVKPSCFGLSQENDYALEKPPTILFRHQLGPIAQSNDGKLVVYPGTILHLECLWIRKYGIPHWQVSHSYRKYPEGWTNDPGRNPHLEYRLSIYHAQKDDSGRFTCITPMGHRHSVDIVVAAVHCPSIPPTPGLHVSNHNTKMDTKVVFSCREGQTLVGGQQASCLPSGNWSADIPICQVTECSDLSNITSQFLKAKISGRVVGSRATFSCSTGYGLRGKEYIICLDTGQWSAPVPYCEEVICEPPEAPKNGYVQDGPKDIYRAGDVLQFACNNNHMMDGKGIMVCQESSRWSAPVPKCVTACQYPGMASDATISNVQFYYHINETVTFDCPDGFELRGAKMLRCLRDGRWSSTTPSCQPVRKG